MTVDTNAIVSVSEANQNFSKRTGRNIQKQQAEVCIDRP